MVKIADRNPDMYSIGVPQVLFNPEPNNGNFQMWADCHALAAAIFGLTNVDGQVVNGFGNNVGSAADLRERCYLGALDTASLGGDIETLEHMVSNMGYQETDRSIVLQRPYSYSLTFDEPDIRNLSRYMVAQETNLAMPIRPLFVTGTTFIGSGNTNVSIISRKLGDPSRALETIITLWLSNGATGLPPDGVYAFIVGGTNEEECTGAWENRRHWIAYATFDFDAKTVSTWSFLRPHGTAAGKSYGSDVIIPINSSVLSIVDSDPMITFCGLTAQWNCRELVAWTGYGWLGADPDFFGYTIINTVAAFKRASGCAVVVTTTEIGVSMIHVIPRCTMMPDGTMDFNADQWQRGQFNLTVLRDAQATYVDRKPALPIPFGYMQTFKMAVNEG